jgi:hypothetical protein
VGCPLGIFEVNVKGSGIGLGGQNQAIGRPEQALQKLVSVAKPMGL